MTAISWQSTVLTCAEKMNIPLVTIKSMLFFLEMKSTKTGTSDPKFPMPLLQASGHQVTFKQIVVSLLSKG